MPRIKSLLNLVLTMAALALPPAHGQSNSEIQDIRRLLNAGQARQALDRVNAYLSTRPKDPVGRFIKGVAQSELGQTNDAIQTFQSLSEDYPELPEPYNNLAVLYSSKGQFEKARVALELAIQTHPTYSTAHENLGDVYAKLASQAYDRALQLDRSNTQVASKLTLVRELFSTQTRVNTPPRTSLAAATSAATAVAQTTPPVASSAQSAAARTATSTGSARPDPAAATAASPPPPPVSNASDPAPVLAAVNAWASHWSRRDANAYLAAYSKNFKPDDGSSRAAWAERRRERVTTPRNIKVDILAPQVTFDGPNQASVVFRQSYQSDTLKTNTRKTLRMVNEGGTWLIVGERSG